MNDEIWESTLVNALNNADDYVWVYTERHDWWGMGGLKKRCRIHG